YESDSIVPISHFLQRTHGSISESMLSSFSASSWRRTTGSIAPRRARRNLSALKLGCPARIGTATGLAPVARRAAGRDLHQHHPPPRDVPHPTLRLEHREADDARVEQAPQRRLAPDEGEARRDVLRPPQRRHRAAHVHGDGADRIAPERERSRRRVARGYRAREELQTVATADRC